MIIALRHPLTYVLNTKRINKWKGSNLRLLKSQGFNTILNYKLNSKSLSMGIEFETPSTKACPIPPTIFF